MLLILSREWVKLALKAGTETTFPSSDAQSLCGLHTSHKINPRHLLTLCLIWQLLLPVVKTVLSSPVAELPLLSVGRFSHSDHGYGE